MQPLVYIIILNWNDYDATIRCLDSIKGITYKNYKVIVIDNASTNESVEILSKVKHIKLLCNSQNLGYAGGNNQAIKRAVQNKADYIWLLNNDAIIAPDCLDKLVAISEKTDDTGLVSPVIYDLESEDKIQHCGTRFSLTVPSIEEANSIDTALNWQQTMPFNMMLWGTALLIPVKTITKIGLLDERLFAYAEDSDYSIRSASAGLKNITVFDAKIWHQGHTGPRMPHYYYYTVRNSFIFWRKHLSFKTYLKIIFWNIHQTRQRILKLNRCPDQIKACKQGLWHGLLGKAGEYKATQKIPWIVNVLL